MAQNALKCKEHDAVLKLKAGWTHMIHLDNAATTRVQYQTLRKSCKSKYD